MKKIISLINEGEKSLKDISDTPRLDVEYILMDILDCNKIDLFLKKDELIDDKLTDKFFNYIEERKNGKPLQYILGYEEFMGNKFFVDENVLIPRMDTEILIDEIIKIYKDKDNLKILDIGTGSGAISITLAIMLNVDEIIALDKYKNVLEIAEKNAVYNEVDDKINFIRSDIFDGISNFNDYFDIIVSNPPYISKEDIKNLQVEIKEHEPLSALDGGVDGLDFYREIVKDSDKYLKENGLLAFEIGYDQGIKVKDMMEEKFKNVRIVKDLSKLDRVVLGFLK